MYAMIMAGGSGTRLWPLSRRGTPKQLLALTGDTSLLQQTVARLDPLLRPHDIYVITSQAHVRATQDQLPQLPPDNVLGEPLARSTAVAAALATVLARRESDEIAIVLPADHFVADDDAFVEALREAARVAERGYLVTLGVVPTHPATGYGYIKAGEPLHPASDTAAVERFVEKPDAATAATFLDEGGYLWNAGHLRVAHVRLSPGARAIPTAAGLGHRGHRGAASDAGLDGRRSRSARADRRDHASTPASRSPPPPRDGWRSCRSRRAGRTSARGRHCSRRSRRATGADLVASGRHLDRGSHRVLVHGGDRLVVTVGLEDVIIVDTPDALLVCHRDRAEEIKPVLDEIAGTAGDRYL